MSQPLRWSVSALGVCVGAGGGGGSGLKMTPSMMIPILQKKHSAMHTTQTAEPKTTRHRWGCRMKEEARGGMSLAERASAYMPVSA